VWKDPTTVAYLCGEKPLESDEWQIRAFDLLKRRSRPLVKFPAPNAHRCGPSSFVLLGGGKEALAAIDPPDAPGYALYFPSLEDPRPSAPVRLEWPPPLADSGLLSCSASVAGDRFAVNDLWTFSLPLPHLPRARLLGQRLAPLVSGPIGDYPLWSPDGKWILFRAGAGTSFYYLLDVASGAALPLEDGGRPLEARGPPLVWGPGALELTEVVYDQAGSTMQSAQMNLVALALRPSSGSGRP
jgi:hypothetical protein